MTPIIKVENLSKQYRIGSRPASYATLRDSLTDVVSAPFRRLKNLANSDGAQFVVRNSQSKFIWALKDVSFKVMPGEVVGVIGRNGAGKSTLLKILSRITEPTTGGVDLRGRVGSLLEVGTGFHPELTGRDNIYLNGAILGMKKGEIDRKFDEIVSFAEIEQFVDTPVKHYSSGMYMRLAFSVAAHLEPEILLIDEVLAVGDASFQKKCLGKMGEVAKEGRTVLFVSHNLSAIQRLCQSGIYLRMGGVETNGNIADVLEAYQRDIEFLGDGEENAMDQAIQVRPGEAKFVNWELMNATTAMLHSCYSREEGKFKFTFVCNREFPKARFGIVLQDFNEQRIIVAHSLDILGKEIDLVPGVYNLVWTIDLPLKAGSYQLVVGASNADSILDQWIAVPRLNILPKLNTHLPEHWHGLVNQEVGLGIERLD